MASEVLESALSSPYETSQGTYAEYLEQALLYEQFHEFEKAARIYAVLLRHYPNDRMLLFHLGMCFFELRQYKRALYWFFQQSKVHEALGQESVSIADSDRLGSLAPGQKIHAILLNYQQIRTLMAMGAPGDIIEEASTELARALGVTAGHQYVRQSFMCMAEYFMEYARYRSALNCYDQVFQEDRMVEAALLVRMAHAHFLLGNFDRCTKLCTQVIEMKKLRAPKERKLNRRKRQSGSKAQEGDGPEEDLEEDEEEEDEDDEEDQGDQEEREGRRSDELQMVHMQARLLRASCVPQSLDRAPEALKDLKVVMAAFPQQTSIWESTTDGSPVGLDGKVGSAMHGKGLLQAIMQQRERVFSYHGGYAAGLFRGSRCSSEYSGCAEKTLGVGTTGPFDGSFHKSDPRVAGYECGSRFGVGDVSRAELAAGAYFRYGQILLMLSQRDMRSLFYAFAAFSEALSYDAWPFPLSRFVIGVEAMRKELEKLNRTQMPKRRTGSMDWAGDPEVEDSAATYNNAAERLDVPPVVQYFSPRCVSRSSLVLMARFYSEIMLRHGPMPHVYFFRAQTRLLCGDIMGYVRDLMRCSVLNVHFIPRFQRTVLFSKHVHFCRQSWSYLEWKLCPLVILPSTSGLSSISVYMGVAERVREYLTSLEESQELTSADTSFVMSCRGHLDRQMGQLDQSAQEFTKSLNKWPTNNEANLGLILIHINQLRLTEAKRLLRKELDGLRNESRNEGVGGDPMAGRSGISRSFVLFETLSKLFRQYIESSVDAAPRSETDSKQAKTEVKESHSAIPGFTPVMRGEVVEEPPQTPKADPSTAWSSKPTLNSFTPWLLDSYPKYAPQAGSLAFFAAQRHDENLFDNPFVSYGARREAAARMAGSFNAFSVDLSAGEESLDESATTDVKSPTSQKKHTYQEKLMVEAMQCTDHLAVSKVSNLLRLTEDEFVCLHNVRRSWMLRRRGSILCALLGYVYELEGFTDTAGRLLLRSLTLDCHCPTAHYILFYHHLRFGNVWSMVQQLRVTMMLNPLFLTGVDLSLLPLLKSPVHFLPEATLSRSFQTKKSETDAMGGVPGYQARLDPLLRNEFTGPTGPNPNEGIFSANRGSFWENPFAYLPQSVIYRSMPLLLMPRSPLHPKAKTPEEESKSDVHDDEHTDTSTTDAGVDPASLVATVYPSLDNPYSEFTVGAWALVDPCADCNVYGHFLFFPVALAECGRRMRWDMGEALPEDVYAAMVNVHDVIDWLHGHQRKVNQQPSKEYSKLSSMASKEYSTQRQFRGQLILAQQLLLRKYRNLILANCPHPIEDASGELWPAYVVDNVYNFAAHSPYVGYTVPDYAYFEWNAYSWYTEALRLIASHNSLGALVCLEECWRENPDFSSGLTHILSTIEANPSGRSNKYSKQAIMEVIGKERLRQLAQLVYEVCNRAQHFEAFFGMIELAYADYSYSMQFAHLFKCYWRRALLCKRRANPSGCLASMNVAISLVERERSNYLKVLQTQSDDGDSSSGKSPKSGFVNKSREKAKAKEVASQLSTRKDNIASYVVILNACLQLFLLVRASLLYDTGRYKSVLTDCDALLFIVSAHPSSSKIIFPAYRLRSLAGAHLSKYKEAIADLERYLSYRSDDIGSVIRLANLYSFIGDHKKALAVFQMVLQHISLAPSAYYGRGLVYFRTGHYDKALADMKTTLKMDPYHADGMCLIRVAELYERSGRLGAAFRTVNERIRIGGCNVPEISKCVGRCHLQVAQTAVSLVKVLREIESHLHAMGAAMKSTRAEARSTGSPLHAMQKRTSADEDAGNQSQSSTDEETEDESSEEDTGHVNDGMVIEVAQNGVVFEDVDVIDGLATRDVEDGADVDDEEDADDEEGEEEVAEEVDGESSDRKQERGKGKDKSSKKNGVPRFSQPSTLPAKPTGTVAAVLQAEYERLLDRARLLRERMAVSGPFARKYADSDDTAELLWAAWCHMRASLDCLQQAVSAHSDDPEALYLLAMVLFFMVGIQWDVSSASEANLGREPAAPTHTLRSFVSGGLTLTSPAVDEDRNRDLLSILKPKLMLLTLLSRALQLKPQLPQALYLRGYVYLSCQDMKKAASDFGDCLRQDPYHLPALSSLACICFHFGQHDRALRLYDRLLSVSTPANTQIRATALACKALVMTLKGRYSSAMTLLDPAVEMAPTCVFALVLRAECQRRMNVIDAAIEDYRRSINVLHHDIEASQQAEKVSAKDELPVSDLVRAAQRAIDMSDVRPHSAHKETSDPARALSYTALTRAESAEEQSQEESEKHARKQAAGHWFAQGKSGTSDSSESKDAATPKASQASVLRRRLRILTEPGSPRHSVASASSATSFTPKARRASRPFGFRGGSMAVAPAVDFKSHKKYQGFLEYRGGFVDVTVGPKLGARFMMLRHGLCMDTLFENGTLNTYRLACVNGIHSDAASERADSMRRSLQGDEEKRKDPLQEILDARKRENERYSIPLDRVGLPDISFLQRCSLLAAVPHFTPQKAEDLLLNQFSSIRRSITDEKLNPLASAAANTPSPAKSAHPAPKSPIPDTASPARRASAGPSAKVNADNLAPASVVREHSRHLSNSLVELNLAVNRAEEAERVQSVASPRRNIIGSPRGINSPRGDGGVPPTPGPVSSGDTIPQHIRTMLREAIEAARVDDGSTTVSRNGWTSNDLSALQNSLGILLERKRLALSMSSKEAVGSDTNQYGEGSMFIGMSMRMEGGTGDSDSSLESSLKLGEYLYKSVIFDANVPMHGFSWVHREARRKSMAANLWSQMQHGGRKTSMGSFQQMRAEEQKEWEALSKGRPTLSADGGDGIARVAAGSPMQMGSGGNPHFMLQPERKQEGELQGKNEEEVIDVLDRQTLMDDVSEDIMRCFSGVRGSYQAHFNRGVLYLRKGDLRNALKDFLASVQRNPEYASGHTNLAVVYERLNLLDMAADELKMALNLNPSHVIALFNQCNIEASRDRFDSAIRFYTEFLKKFLQGAGVVLQKWTGNSAGGSSSTKSSPLRASSTRSISHERMLSTVSGRVDQNMVVSRPAAPVSSNASTHDPLLDALLQHCGIAMELKLAKRVANKLPQSLRRVFLELCTHRSTLGNGNNLWEMLKNRAAGSLPERPTRAEDGADLATEEQDGAVSRTPASQDPVIGTTSDAATLELFAMTTKNDEDEEVLTITNERSADGQQPSFEERMAEWLELRRQAVYKELDKFLHREETYVLVGSHERQQLLAALVSYVKRLSRYARASQAAARAIVRTQRALDSGEDVTMMISADSGGVELNERNAILSAAPEKMDMQSLIGPSLTVADEDVLGRLRTKRGRRGRQADKRDGKAREKTRRGFGIHTGVESAKKHPMGLSDAMVDDDDEEMSSDASDYMDECSKQITALQKKPDDGDMDAVGVGNAENARQQLMLKQGHKHTSGLYVYRLVPLVLNNRGLCYHRLGDLQRALENYSYALRLEPRLAFIRLNRAHVYADLGLYYSAMRDIFVVQAVRNSPYTSRFYHFCKRVQWALAVACRDFFLGLRTLSGVISLDLTGPVIPADLFNPFRLVSHHSREFRCIERLFYLVRDLPGTKGHSRPGSFGSVGSPTGQDEGKHSHSRHPSSAVHSRHTSTMNARQSVRVDSGSVGSLDSDAFFGDASLKDADSHMRLITNLEEALNAQLLGEHKTAYNCLIRCSYLIPNKDPWTAFSSAARDTKEIIALWRARVQVYLDNFRGAINVMGEAVLNSVPSRSRRFVQSLDKVSEADVMHSERVGSMDMGQYIARTPTASAKHRMKTLSGEIVGARLESPPVSKPGSFRDSDSSLEDGSTLRAGMFKFRKLRGTSMGSTDTEAKGSMDVTNLKAKGKKSEVEKEIEASVNVFRWELNPTNASWSNLAMLYDSVDSFSPLAASCCFLELMNECICVIEAREVEVARIIRSESRRAALVYTASNPLDIGHTAATQMSMLLGVDALHWMKLALAVRDVYTRMQFPTPQKASHESGSELWERMVDELLQPDSVVTQETTMSARTRSTGSLRMRLRSSRSDITLREFSERTDASDAPASSSSGMRSLLMESTSHASGSASAISVLNRDETETTEPPQSAGSSSIPSSVTNVPWECIRNCLQVNDAAYTELLVTTLNIGTWHSRRKAKSERKSNDGDGSPGPSSSSHGFVSPGGYSPAFSELTPLASDIRDSRILNYIGSLQQRHEQYQMAKESFSRSLKLCSLNLYALVNRGRLLRSEGRFAGAFRDFLAVATVVEYSRTSDLSSQESKVLQLLYMYAGLFQDSVPKPSWAGMQKLQGHLAIAMHSLRKQLDSRRGKTSGSAEVPAEIRQADDITQDTLSTLVEASSRSIQHRLREHALASSATLVDFNVLPVTAEMRPGAGEWAKQNTGSLPAGVDFGVTGRNAFAELGMSVFGGGTSVVGNVSGLRRPTAHTSTEGGVGMSLVGERSRVAVRSVLHGDRVAASVANHQQAVREQERIRRERRDHAPPAQLQAEEVPLEDATRQNADLLQDVEHIIDSVVNQGQLLHDHHKRKLADQERESLVSGPAVGKLKRNSKWRVVQKRMLGRAAHEKRQSLHAEALPKRQESKRGLTVNRKSWATRQGVDQPDFIDTSFGGESGIFGGPGALDAIRGSPGSSGQSARRQRPAPEPPARARTVRESQRDALLHRLEASLREGAKKS